jgi:hypothetical protein
MIYAIMAGRKTQTRRIIKPQPQSRLCYIINGKNHGKWTYPSKRVAESLGEKYRIPDIISEDDLQRKWTCPAHVEGNNNILWVKETWRETPDGYRYRAGSTWGISEGGPWKPSIFMPRKAARLFLRVKRVSIQRLQDITDEEALAEGVPGNRDYPIPEIYCPQCCGEGTCGAMGENMGWTSVDCDNCDTPAKQFRNLWDALRKPADLALHGWDANPFVWVIEFERAEDNE